MPSEHKASGRTSQTVQLAVGVGFLLLGILGLVLLNCPKAGQAYGLVIAIVVGAAILVFALTGVFQLSGPWRGFTSAGAGTVFLLLFFLTPGPLDRIQCTDDLHTLHLRVCAQTGCPAEAIAQARVSVMHLRTQTVEMNDAGEGSYSYRTNDVGQTVQLWAEADGFARSAPREFALPQEPVARALIALAREGESPNVVAIPSLGTGDAWPAIAQLDLTQIEPLLAEPAGRERELAAFGTAALARGNYEAAVKLLEAAQRTPAGAGLSTTTPMLAAAYFELGRAQRGEEILEQARAEVPPAPADAGARLRLRILAGNAELAADATGRRHPDLVLLGRAASEAAGQMQ
jgi:hypothetical protein